MLTRWSTLPQGQKTTALFGVNLATTVLKVLVFDKAYQAEGYSDRDRKLLVHTEWIRQLVSAGLWLGASMSGLMMSQRLLPKANAMEHLLIGNLVAQLADTVIRPVMTAKLAKYFVPKPVSTPALSTGKAPAVSRDSAWTSVDSRLGFTTQFQNQGYSTNPFAQTASLFSPVRY